MMNKKVRRTLFNVFLLLACSIIVVVIVFRNNADEIFTILPAINKKMLLLTLVFFLLTYVVDALNYWIMGRKYISNYRYRDGMLVTWMGSFFSAITPSATGGQIGQIHVLRKQGMHVEQGANLLVIQWIAQELAVVLFCAVTLIISYVFKYNTIQKIHIFNFDMNFIIFAIIGFALHLFAIWGVLGLSFAKWTKVFIEWIIKTLAKFHIISQEKKDSWLGKVDKKVTTYRNELKNFKSNSKYFFPALLCNILRLAIYFATPYFVALTLNLTIAFEEIGAAIVLSSFLYLITSFVPIPGASGGTEAFFLIIFASYFKTAGNTATALIIWRTATFYVGFVIGLLVVIFYNRTRKVNIVQESLPEEPMIKIEVKVKRVNILDNKDVIKDEKDQENQ